MVCCQPQSMEMIEVIFNRGGRIKMKQLMSIAWILLALFAAPNGYAGEDEAIKSLLPVYVEVQEALAKDDFGLVKIKIGELKAKAVGKEHHGLKSPMLDEVKASVGSMEKASDLASARKEFKKLSSPFVRWMEKHHESGFEVFYCPMAGSKWIQKSGGKATNPYFGHEMLHCGEKAS